MNRRSFFKTATGFITGILFGGYFIPKSFTRSQWVSFSDVDGKWHFLVDDFDGNEHKLYIDGRLVI